MYLLSTLINAFIDLLLDLDVTQTSKTELEKLDEQHVSEVKAGRKRKPYFSLERQRSFSLENTRVIMEMYLPLGNSNRNFRI